MRTIVNAQYQLDKIMPIARKEGCKCEYTKADFQNFINGMWQHNKDCPAQHYECLPNPAGLIQALRHL